MNYKNFYLQATEIADRIAQGDKSVSQRSKQGVEEVQQGLVSRKRQIQEQRTEEAQKPEYPGFLAEVISTLNTPDNSAEVKVATEGTPRPRKFTENVETREYGRMLMSDLQEIFGISKEQAAGIVGNLDHETGGFKFMQEIEPVVPGSRGGFGFAQWTGPRRKQFEAWVKKNGMDIRSYEANLGFLVHELQNTGEGKVLEELQNAKTPQEAAEIFSAGFLRPGVPKMESRVARANKYYSEV